MGDDGRTEQHDYVAAVVKAVTFIESSLGERFDLDAVCGHAHLSKFYFSRIFQAMVGETVFDYVRKRRLAEIAHRLVTTSEPIFDLAFGFGYESQQSMTKAFHAQYGVAPGAYRRAGKDRFLFHRARLSRDAIVDLHRDFSLQTHVFALPALRLVGVRAAMPITDPEPVERTREAFWAGAAAVAPLRRYRGVFEVTLMRHEQMREYAPDDLFEGFIGYAVGDGGAGCGPGAGTGGVRGDGAAGAGGPRGDGDRAAGSDNRGASGGSVLAGWTEMSMPASRYLTFHYTGADSIRELSSLYRYIFSSGLAGRREPLADRDFFHYYRPGVSSMLFFLPIE